MFSQIIKLFRVISSETSPLQISSGLALSMIAGLTPIMSLHNIIVIFLLLIFRINIAAFFLGLVFFSGIGYLLDPTFHSLGYSILNNPALAEAWTSLYNNNLFRLSSFNNTIVMGSLTISLIAFLPAMLICNLLIKYYRSHFLEYLDNSKMFRIVKNSKILTRIISMAE